MVPSLTDTHCTNGHDLAVVGLYSVRAGRIHFCRKCHRDTIARSRKRLSAIREHPSQLVTDAERKRFWAKVNRSDAGCWEWTAATQVSSPKHRYGVFLIAGTNRLAHRVSYALRHGTVPDGMDLDHLCRNTLCVNPDHLEAVTHRENMRRGIIGLSWTDGPDEITTVVAPKE